MMKKFNIDVHQKNSILFMVIGVGILFIIILVAILPLYLRISNQARDNKILETKIREQKDWGPLYQTLLSEIDMSRKMIPPPVIKTTLSRNETKRFQNDFEAVAKKSGLKIVSFEQDTSVTSSLGTVLPYRAVLKGEWSNIRRLLMDLGAIAYVESMEELSIKQSTTALELDMKVLIAVH